MPGVRARVDLIRWSWGGQPSRTFPTCPPVLLRTAPLPELGRTRQGLVAAGAWTRPWSPGPQLQLRPPGQAPDLSGHFCPQTPVRLQHLFPVTCQPSGRGQEVSQAAARLCTAAEDQDRQTHVCDGASSLFYEKDFWVIARAWKSARNIVQMSEAPRSAGKPANLRQDSAPTHPGIRDSTPPPPAPTALARCCPPAYAQFWGEAPCLAQEAHPA